MSITGIVFFSKELRDHILQELRLNIIHTYSIYVSGYLNIKNALIEQPCKYSNNAVNSM